MAWEYYGVKTFHKHYAVGKPKNLDKYYDKDGAVFEERVILVRARNFDEAIRKGEKEAKKYSEWEDNPFKNRYGQKVRQKFLEVVDVFFLFDNPPKAGSEVFSAMHRIKNKQNLNEVINNKLGPKEKSLKWREKFTPWSVD